jgi:methyl-accepting chemotaxis protein
VIVFAVLRGANSHCQAVVTFSPDGVVVEANDIFLDTMGYEQKQIVGKHHRLFMPPEDVNKPEYLEFWQAMREGSGFAQGEFKRIAKGGRVVWLNATYTPIVLDGRVIKVVKYAQDITEEKMKSK